MTREEAKKILGEGATEEQVTNLLSNYHDVEKSNKEEINSLKAQLNQYSDYEDIKKQLDEVKQANMTEQEKLARDKEETARNLAESKIIKHTAIAKDILAGLNVSDSIIAKLVSEDENATLTSVNELKTMLETQKENVAKATKESLVNLDLKPDLSNVPQGDEKMTFDKFATLSAEEQEKFINEHPQEFENL